MSIKHDVDDSDLDNEGRICVVCESRVYRYGCWDNFNDLSGEDAGDILYCDTCETEILDKEVDRWKKKNGDV